MLLKDAVVVKDTIEKACLWQCDDDVDFCSPSKGQWRAPSRALPCPATELHVSYCGYVKLTRLEIIQVRTLLTKQKGMLTIIRGKLPQN